MSVDLSCVFQQPQQQGPRMANPQQQQQQQATGPQPQQQTVPALTSLPQPVLNGSAPPTQQIVIRPPQPGMPGSQQIIIRNAVPVQAPPTSTNEMAATTNQQEKANKIIAEAIAKAQKSGNTAIPKVLQPPDLPAPLGELESLEATPEDGGKKKKKRKYTPKKDKDKDGEKTPKEKKKKKVKEKVVKEEKVDISAENSEASFGGNLPFGLGVDDDMEDSKLEIDESGGEEKTKKPKKKKSSKKEPSEKTPKSEKKKPKK